MIKAVSTTWPWDHGKFTQTDVIDMAVELGVDELCIRTPVFTNQYNPTWHDELVRQANETNIDISLWPVVACRFPEQEADAIKEAVVRFGAKRVVIDAENKTWMDKLERFLNNLGRLPVPVGLGSFRRANYHPEMRWQVWLQHKSGGQHTIDFAAHQLYPIGWLRPESWQYQFRLDIDSHERQHAIAGRSGIKWLPWMPAFVGTGFENAPGWQPPVDSVRTAVEYMTGRLGDRLIGMNWWSLDKDLHKLGELYQYVKSLPSEGVPTPPNDIQLKIEEALASAQHAVDVLESIE